MPRMLREILETRGAVSVCFVCLLFFFLFSSANIASRSDGEGQHEEARRRQDAAAAARLSSARPEDDCQRDVSSVFVFVLLQAHRSFSLSLALSLSLSRFVRSYGYASAGFSGRMPCAELADSIVQVSGGGGGAIRFVC